LFPFSYKDRENEDDDDYEEDDSLPVVYPPFLPCITDDTKKYTLVLDLDETLIHFEDVRLCYFSYIIELR
jgi:hypothetical protein